jgi:tRNA A22 N-methylase
MMVSDQLHNCSDKKLLAMLLEEHQEVSNAKARGDKAAEQRSARIIIRINKILKMRRVL